MLDPFADCGEESGHMRQFGVRLEAGLVFPNGMDEEYRGLAEGREQADLQAGRFRPSGSQDGQESKLELLFPPSLALETHKDIQRHNDTSASICCNFG